MCWDLSGFDEVCRDLTGYVEVCQGLLGFEIIGQNVIIRHTQTYLDTSGFVGV